MYKIVFLAAAFLEQGIRERREEKESKMKWKKPKIDSRRRFSKYLSL